MMNNKIIIPINGNEIAPRFDLASEVLIIIWGNKKNTPSEKIIVLPKASADNICHMMISEGIKTLICCGIEEEFYEYLNWKKIKIIDNVSGSHRKAVKLYIQGRLKPGDILLTRKTEGTIIK